MADYDQAKLNELARDITAFREALRAPDSQPADWREQITALQERLQDFQDVPWHTPLERNKDQIAVDMGNLRDIVKGLDAKLGKREKARAVPASPVTDEAAARQADEENRLKDQARLQEETKELQRQTQEALEKAQAERQADPAAAALRAQEDEAYRLQTQGLQGYSTTTSASKDIEPAPVSRAEAALRDIFNGKADIIPGMVLLDQWRMDYEADQRSFTSVAGANDPAIEQQGLRQIGYLALQEEGYSPPSGPLDAAFYEDKGRAYYEAQGKEIPDYAGLMRDASLLQSTAGAAALERLPELLQVETPRRIMVDPHNTLGPLLDRFKQGYDDPQNQGAVVREIAEGLLKGDYNHPLQSDAETAIQLYKTAADMGDVPSIVALMKMTKTGMIEVQGQTMTLAQAHVDARVLKQDEMLAQEMHDRLKASPHFQFEQVAGPDARYPGYQDFIRSLEKPLAGYQPPPDLKHSAIGFTSL